MAVALQEFVLLAAQNKAGASGGLRDKPGKRPDLYHTCNNLSGLAIAQHHMVHQPLLVEANRRKFDTSKGMPAIKPTKPEGGWKTEEERQRARKEVWANALGWTQLGEDTVLGGKVNKVVSLSSRASRAELTGERNDPSLQHSTVKISSLHQLLLRPKRIDSRF